MAVLERSPSIIEGLSSGSNGTAKGRRFATANFQARTAL
jgi:hypothetical protein